MRAELQEARPAGSEQVAGIVREARGNSMPLFVRSSGGQHRHGANEVARGKTARMIDMSGMSRIVRLDRKNKAALIEPGVTFVELVGEARKKGLRPNLPLCPRPSKSVVASALEREPVIMPRYQWDLVDPLMSLEIVLGTGDVFRTGSGAGPGTLEEQWASGQAQKSPMGPSQFDPVRLIQGAQGTMGIVTWASLRMELIPSAQELFFIGSSELGSLVRLIYRLSHRRFGEQCLVLNAAALAALVKTDKNDIAAFGAGLPEWVLILGLAGFERRPRERLDYQAAEVRAFARELGLSPRTSLDGLTAGRMEEILAGPCSEPYWMDRAMGGAKEVFFLTTLDQADHYISLAKEAAASSDYSDYLSAMLGVYVQPLLGGRVAHVEIILPHEPGQQIGHVFDRISRTLMQEGAYFSRPYGSWADMVWQRDPAMKDAVLKVKKIFDPDGIMSPGRLGLGV